MPAAPLHLFEAGVVTDQRYVGVGEAPAVLGAALVGRLHPEKRVRIPFNPRDRWLTAARESCRTLADAVGASRKAGATCVVLGGECTIVAGSVPGAIQADPDLVLVYFDAHGDFNTLATTPSHYVGGMCLAHVAGRPVAPLLWPGVKGIPDDHVVLVGGRELDPGEAGNLSKSRVVRVMFDPDNSDAPGLIAQVRRKPLWVHVDMDIVDPRELPAVAFPVPRGPSLGDLGVVLRSVAQVSEIRGVEICGYDASKDSEGKFVAPLIDVIATALGRAPVRA